MIGLRCVSTRRWIWTSLCTPCLFLRFGSVRFGFVESLSDRFGSNMTFVHIIWFGSVRQFGAIILSDVKKILQQYWPESEPSSTKRRQTKSNRIIQEETICDASEPNQNKRFDCDGAPYPLLYLLCYVTWRDVTERGVSSAASVKTMAGPSEARPHGVDVRRLQAGVRSIVHPCVEYHPLHSGGESYLSYCSVIPGFFSINSIPRMSRGVRVLVSIHTAERSWSVYLKIDPLHHVVHQLYII